MGLDRLKFANFVKEIYLDSDTTVGLLSGAPFDDPTKWFLSNDQIKAASERVNSVGRIAAAAVPLLGHAQTTRLDGRSRSRDRGGASDQLEVLYDRRSAEPGEHEVSVAAGRRTADVPVLRKGGEGRHQPTSASTKDCCRRTTKPRFRTPGATPRSTMSARRRKTGRR